MLSINTLRSMLYTLRSTLSSLRSTLYAFILLFSLNNTNAQPRNIYYNLQSSASYITSDQVPFWLRSNQFGSVPLDNASLSLTGAIRKDYDISKIRAIDWGAALESRANIGYQLNATLVEGYVKLRVSIFEIRAGRSKEITGLCDTSLSSGAWSVSGNALGIPKVEISIPEFYTLPLFGKLFAFKGNYAHGWMGETSVRNMQGNVLQIGTWLHQKSLYGKFGKPNWKLKLYGGFNHQIQWGNEPDIYGDSYTMSPVKTYVYVITGKRYSGSRIGNSLGSIDVGFEYAFSKVRLFAYRQNIYEAGALYYLANLRDGLNGVSLTNIQPHKPNAFQWRKILVELLYTKNQAGELWSKHTASGDENYFNNDQYREGWSYKGIGIGNPFVSPKASTREGLTSYPSDYFINNRVVALHLGFEGSVQEWNFVLKTSYSLNYGTFGTSEAGRSIGNSRTPPQYGIFGEKKQFSAFLEATRELKKGLHVGITGAFDVGKLYYDCFGVMLGVGKRF